MPCASSCYRESALAAAIMSQELGRPVRVQLSREDQFGYDNYGPAHLADIRAAVGADGRIVAFEYQQWSHGGLEWQRSNTSRSAASR
jgi:CO/xanthine dehydrogenase Mo-binding subunit